MCASVAEKSQDGGTFTVNLNIIYLLLPLLVLFVSRTVILKSYMFCLFVFSPKKPGEVGCAALNKV